MIPSGRRSRQLNFQQISGLHRGQQVANQRLRDRLPYVRRSIVNLALIERDLAVRSARIQQAHVTFRQTPKERSRNARWFAELTRMSITSLS